MPDDTDIMNKHPLPCIGDRMVVALRAPVLVILQGVLRWVVAFEGQFCNQSDKVMVFASMRMFAKINTEHEAKLKGVRYEPITMRADLTVPIDNLAGMLPMPKAS